MSKATNTKSTPLPRKKNSQRPNRNIETWVAISILIASLGIGIMAWRTKGEIIYTITDALRSMDKLSTAGKDPTLNCMDRFNKNTPYCQDRAARAESNWEGINRNSAGRANAFGLRDR